MADFDIGAYVSRIEANRSVKDALMLTLKTRRPPYRISVTDLLNIKQAYFRRKYPEITPPLEKRQLMWAGTGFHKTFGSAVSSEEYQEQFVEAEGIVGKIDIYEKIPVEVKTTSTPIDTKDLLRDRPTYVEQLGMYCAMVNAHEGEIIVYRRPVDESSSTSPLVVYHVSFPDLKAIREEMRRRRDLLVQALISNDPSNLPVCPWFDKQCDYSQVCDCATTSVPASREIADLAGEIRADTTACKQLINKMAAAQPYELFGINDIVFPRKAYFERPKLQEPAPGEEVREEKEEHLRSILQAADHPALKTIYDPSHFDLMNGSTGKPHEMLQRIGVENIGYIHFTDTDGTRRDGGTSKHLPCGDGHIDVTASLETLWKGGFRGWMNIDTWEIRDPYDACLKAKRAIDAFSAEL